MNFTCSTARCIRPLRHIADDGYKNEVDELVSHYVNGSSFYNRPVIDINAAKESIDSLKPNKATGDDDTMST